MSIVKPAWFDAPWAAAQQLSELTAAGMAQGFPSGIAQRPTRQQLNRAIEFASNGVLYYMRSGMPDWMTEAQYAIGSVCYFQNRFYRSNTNQRGVVPTVNGAAWELLFWRIAEIEGFYVPRHDHGFLMWSIGDVRYYPRAEMDATFITPAQMAAQFAPVASLTPLLRRDFGVLLFLTRDVADARYAALATSVPIDDLPALLLPLLSRADAAARFITEQSGALRWLTEATGRSVFLGVEQAQQTLQRLDDAAISIYSPTQTYRAGVLVFDSVTGAFFRSLADDNLGNALTDTNYWEPWLMPALQQSQDGRFLHRLLVTPHEPNEGDYTLVADDIPPFERYPDGILMKFRLKGGGGQELTHGGSEAMTLEVIAKMKVSDFPVTVRAGHGEGDDRNSSIESSVIRRLLALNVNGAAIDDWSADDDSLFNYTGKTVFPNYVVDLSHVINPAPLAVYQSNRYAISGQSVIATLTLQPDLTYHVRLHFSENDSTNPGQRVFHININGSRAHSNVDVNALAGGRLIALILEAFAVSDANGKIVIVLESVSGTPIINGIEINAEATYFAVAGGLPATAQAPAPPAGATAYLVNKRFEVLSQRIIRGAEGRWYTESIRGGDGGGVHGSSGRIFANVPAPIALYGGGSGGRVATRLFAINAGGTAISNWTADYYFSDGSFIGSHTSGVTLGAATRPAPLVVYYSCRYGPAGVPFNVTLPVKPSQHYKVRLHFCEGWTSDVGVRIFHVSINSRRVLSFVDLVARIGYATVLIKDFFIAANATDRIVVLFETTPQGNGDAIISGVEVESTTRAYALNCGGDGIYDWMGDESGIFSTSVTWSPNATIDLSKTANPAPQIIYQSARYESAFTVTIPVLALQKYRVRLHFMTDHAGRTFHININGIRVAANVNTADIVGVFAALALDFETETDATGTIVILLETVVLNALLCGVEVELLRREPGGDGFVEIYW